MKSKPIYSAALFCICLLLSFSACKSKQKISTGSSPSKKGTSVESILLAQPVFTTADISRMKLSLQTSEKTHNVSASCKIYRDSAIQLSIQPFMGIELFRVELSPQKAIIIDKMNSDCYESNYQDIAALLGITIDFYDIQAMICNQLFTIGNRDGLDEIKVRGNILSYKKHQTEQTTFVNESDRIISTQITDSKGNQLTANYNDFKSFAQTNTPQQLTLEIQGTEEKVVLDFSVSRVSYNESIKLVYTNLDRYTKIPLTQLKGLSF